MNFSVLSQENKSVVAVQHEHYILSGGPRSSPIRAGPPRNPKRRSIMKDRNLPSEYASIEAHIRRAQVERSVVLGRLFAEGALALGRGVRGALHAILYSVSLARDARTVEAQALFPRTIHR
jgi:hypothetical protein